MFITRVFPPPRGTFPVPLGKPPREDVYPNREHLANVVVPQLDYILRLEKRWLILVIPLVHVTADMTFRGLILVFHKPPRLQKKAFPPAQLAVQNESSILSLTPFVEDWLKRGIITYLNTPTWVFWSRIFHVHEVGR